MTYEAFLNRKSHRPLERGLKPPFDLSNVLFDFQSFSTEKMLRLGSGALFLETGFGKTLCQVAWADKIAREVGPVLILAPLAVAPQTVREAKEKLGIDVLHSKDGTKSSGITITNYERLHHFNPQDFPAVVIDESSCLKSFSSATTQGLIDAFRHAPYKLACTATPAPNDYEELGNHAEFLSVMSRLEMLSRWFVHDSANTSQWRLKGHAIEDFWRWVGTWAMCISDPKDLGEDAFRFTLPPMNVELHTVSVDESKGSEDGLLFRAGGISATGMHKEKRLSIKERVNKALSLWNGDYCVIWCESNDESSAIKDAFGKDGVEVRGSDDIDEKEAKIDAFTRGDVPWIISKRSICGFGVNWQHCAHCIDASISYSYEQLYQAWRRLWRFGQKRPVKCDVIISDGEYDIWKTQKRKLDSHDQMKKAMRFAGMSKDSEKKLDYVQPSHKGRLPEWLFTNQIAA